MGIHLILSMLVVGFCPTRPDRIFSIGFSRDVMGYLMTMLRETCQADVRISPGIKLGDHSSLSGYYTSSHICPRCSNAPSDFCDSLVHLLSNQALTVKRGMTRMHVGIKLIASFERGVFVQKFCSRCWRQLLRVAAPRILSR